MKEEEKELEQTQEVPVYEIQKVKVNNSRLTAEYQERFREANYSNKVTKQSAQIVHDDLRYALSLLAPHVVSICEMPEAERINVTDPSDTDLNETLKDIVVTGYSKGGSAESAGVSIQAQKLLKSGKVLNITVPFVQYESEDGDGYEYGIELQQAISRCDYEVDAYLFEGKCGLRQESFDFDTPEDSSIDVTSQGDTVEITVKPKRRGRKKKEVEESVAEAAEPKAFDEFA